MIELWLWFKDRGSMAHRFTCLEPAHHQGGDPKTLILTWMRNFAYFILDTKCASCFKAQRAAGQITELIAYVPVHPYFSANPFFLAP